MAFGKTANAMHADALITIAAVDNSVGVGPTVEMVGVSFGYDAVPTAGILKIESPVGTIIQEWPVTNSGPGFIPTSSLQGAVGQTVVVTLTDGGSGVTGYVNAIYQ